MDHGLKVGSVLGGMQSGGQKGVVWIQVVPFVLSWECRCR